jgi:Tol biopolymer transport system component
LFLPGGDRFLYLARWRRPERNGVFLGSLNGPGLKQRVLTGDTNVALEGARVLFAKPWTVFEQQLDADRVTLLGEAEPLAGGLAFHADRRAGVFAAAPGAVAYGLREPPRTQLVVVDRTGRELRSTDVPDVVRNFSLSPDGRRVAVEQLDSAIGTDDIWLIDWERGSRTRLTNEPANETDQVWSPDGESIVYSTIREGSAALVRRDVGRTAATAWVLHREHSTFAEDWTHDGRHLVAVEGPDGDRRIVLVSADGLREHRVLVERAASEDEPSLSPDGKLLAYNSSESGRQEIYVISLDGTDRRWQVSVTGGVQPRWRGDGRELFFLGLDGAVMSAQPLASIQPILAARVGWTEASLLHGAVAKPHARSVRRRARRTDVRAGRSRAQPGPSASGRPSVEVC